MQHYTAAWKALARCWASTNSGLIGQLERKGKAKMRGMRFSFWLRVLSFLFLLFPLFLSTLSLWSISLMPFLRKGFSIFFNLPCFLALVIRVSPMLFTMLFILTHARVFPQGAALLLPVLPALPLLSFP